jgi:hypothetical protein
MVLCRPDQCLETVAADEFDAFWQRDEDIRGRYVFTLLNDVGDPGDDVNENPPLPSCTSNRFDGEVRRQLAFGDFGVGAADHLKNVVYTMLQNGECAQEITFADVAARERALAAVETGRRRHRQGYPRLGGHHRL